VPSRLMNDLVFVLVAQQVSNHRALACKDSHHHSPAPAQTQSAQVSVSGGEHQRAGNSTAELIALPSALPPLERPRMSGGQGPCAARKRSGMWQRPHPACLKDNDGCCETASR
jgi:hypothetical protein